MQIERRNQFTDKNSGSGSQVEHELSTISEVFNDHDQGRRAWTTLAAKTSVHTSTGNYTIGNVETILVINKTVAATTTVTLPSSPLTGRLVFVKDGKGDAATNNITVQAASGNVDGSATQLIAVNYGSLLLIYNGTQWNIVARNVPIVLPVSIANGGTNSSTALNNNRIMISSSGAIVEQAAQTSGRVLIADGNGLPISTGNGEINGALTMGGNVSFTTTSTMGIVGSATNDSAAAGNVGEYVVARQSTATNFPTSTQLGDLVSISLTAGDWDVSLVLTANLNGATMTNFRTGISVTSGNSTAGLVAGDNDARGPAPTANNNHTMSIPNYRVSITSTTTHYLKYSATYSAGTPQATGRLSARRVR